MSLTRRTRFSAAIMSAGIAGLVASALVVPSASAADGDPHLPSIPRQPSVSTAPTDQFIVKFKSTGRSASALRAQSFNRAAAKLGATGQDLHATVNGARVVRTSKELGQDDADKLLAALRADPAVAYAEPDVKLQAKSADPNDPFFPWQWNLSAETGGIKVTRAWDVTQGAGQVVAVIDTGKTDHVDLNANMLPGYDMITDDRDARDGDGRDPDATDEGDWSSAGQCISGSAEMASSWHGTHMAGIIAAVANNAEGIAGIAPKAKILPVRVLGPCGGQLSDIADAIVWASGGAVDGVPANPNPARVINLSLGGTDPENPTCPRTFQAAIDTATARGSVVVAAAGNEMAEASTSSPANCDNVISVAASGRTGALAPYSNFGSAVDITAPGGDMRPTDVRDPDSGVQNGILSTLNDGDRTAGQEAYFFAEGTSAAAPHVSGAAALLMAQMGPTATPAAVEARLKRTARPMTGGCPQGCGAGRLDAATAVLHITAVLAAGDFTGDGKADVLARENSGFLWLYPGNGAGGWLARKQVGSGWNGFTSLVAPGDFNGDRRADVLARDASGAMWLYPGNGAGGWLARKQVGSGWNGFTAIVGAGDINGDGRADVLARDATGVLWLYPGNGRGGWLTRSKVGSGWNAMTAVVGPGDLTGDRKADLLARDADGVLWRYSGNGRGGFGSNVQVGSGWNSMTTITGRGDYSGDARTDILSVDTNGGLWLYRGNGLGGFSGGTQTGVGWD